MPVSKRITLMAICAALICALAVLPALAEPKGKKVLIKAVKEVGTILILQDGSEWRIDELSDQRLVYDWLPFQTVIVKKNGELVNMQRGDIVDGTLVVKPTVKVSEKTGAPKPVPVATAAPASPATIRAERQVTKDLQKATDRLEQVTRQLERVVNRLEDQEFKIKAMELRLNQLERMAGVENP